MLLLYHFLSFVTPNLPELSNYVQSNVIAEGVPIRIKNGDPLEIGFISSRGDGELHGSLNIDLSDLSFATPLTVES
jgi:hypothetical protein